MLYGHGDDSYQSQYDILGNFSSNVWHEGPRPELLQFLKEQLGCIASYPEVKGESLAQTLAEFHKLEAENFLVCNGATEAFALIAHSWQQKHSCIYVPAFAEYEDSCRLYQHQLSFAKRNQLTSSELPECDLIWLGNPNNPDGIINTAAELKSIIATHPETIFVVDEAYIQFTEKGESLIQEMEQLKNLMVVRSMTKYYAIPGLRLGYIAACAELIEKLEAFKLPWTTNGLAIEAGKFLVQNNESLKPNMPKALQEAQSFFSALKNIKELELMPSVTNYCLIRLPEAKSAELKQYLIENFGLLIRDASNFRMLDGHYIRVASQSRELNETLVKAIELWIQSI